MKNVILKIFRYFFITIFVLFVLMICLQRFSNNRISLFNFRLFTVITGSMEPKYKVGDVLVAVETSPENIKVGDAVSYLGNKGEVKNKVITHEVVKIEKNSQGKYRFHTKGICDNCMKEDPIVDESQLYGVVKYKVQSLSFIYKVVGKPLGFFLFVVVPILYIVISEIVTSLVEKEKERRSRI